jgi:hypothetical protein
MVTWITASSKVTLQGLGSLMKSKSRSGGGGACLLIFSLWSRDLEKNIECHIDAGKVVENVVSVFSVMCVSCVMY